MLNPLRVGFCARRARGLSVLQQVGQDFRVCLWGWVSKGKAKDTNVCPTGKSRRDKLDSFIIRRSRVSLCFCFPLGFDFVHVKVETSDRQKKAPLGGGAFQQHSAPWRVLTTQWRNDTSRNFQRSIRCAGYFAGSGVSAQKRRNDNGAARQ